MKVGNWENSLHARNREKEMHQRAGRGAGGAPVSRDGGRWLEGGAPALTAGVEWGVPGEEAPGPGRTERRATPASTPWPSLFTIYSSRCLCNPPGGELRGGAFPSLFHPPRAPLEGPPSLVFHWLGETPFFPSRFSTG